MEKKNIIIIILIAIIAIIGIGIILSAGMPHEKTYETYNFSSTCSIELPTWISFNNGAGDLNSNNSVMGSTVESTTKALFGNNEVMQITYGHDTVDGANVGVDMNDNMVFEQNGKKVYTRMVMSEETGESITVMGENEEVVNYIADHVKFNGKNATTNATNETSNTVNTNVQSSNTNNDDDSVEDDGIERDGRYDGKFDNRVDLNDAYWQGYDDAQSQQSNYADDDNYYSSEYAGSSESGSDSGASY